MSKLDSERLAPRAAGRAASAYRNDGSRRMLTATVHTQTSPSVPAAVAGGAGTGSCCSGDVLALTGGDGMLLDAADGGGVAGTQAGNVRSMISPFACRSNRSELSRKQQRHEGGEKPAGPPCAAVLTACLDPEPTDHVDETRTVCQGSRPRRVFNRGRATPMVSECFYCDTSPRNYRACTKRCRDQRSRMMMWLDVLVLI